MIENNIHQIWVGDARIPSHIKYYMDEVKEFNADFNYYFWNDHNLPELPKNLQKIYDSYKEPAIKADLLRMYVVNTFGGIYLDVDFKLMHGFYSSTVPFNNYDGFMLYNDVYKMSALSNGIFGFKKEHRLLKYMIDNITHEQQWIGPNWWSQIICKYLDLNNEKSTVEELKEKLNSINLQIIRWHDLENTFFLHEALASWVEGSFWNKKFKNGEYE
jgi:mannosyltransferase OCH1-like enzyme